jgi:hypothetical protein
MTTTLTNLGDRLALILDREVLKSHGIDERTSLEIVVDESGIHIRAASDDREDRVRAAALRVMENHDETLRKLAL